LCLTEHYYLLQIRTKHFGMENVRFSEEMCLATPEYSLIFPLLTNIYVHLY